MAVDDEPPALKALGRALASAADFTLEVSCSDPLLAEALIREREPDVLFLDMHMPGRGGLDIARQVARTLGHDAPLMVFLTAYDTFAVAAFEAQAIDYLLKPIERTRLASTLDRLRRTLADRATRDVVPRLEALLQQFARLPAAGPGVASLTLERLSIKHGDRTTRVDPRLIDRVDASDNEVVISLRTEQLRVRETLTAFHQRLPASLFLRVHRSCIVNVQRVTQLEPYFHGDVVIHLANNTKVISGRTYRARVRAALGLRSAGEQGAE